MKCEIQKIKNKHNSTKLKEKQHINFKRKNKNGIPIFGNSRKKYLNIKIIIKEKLEMKCETQKEKTNTIAPN